MHLVIKFSLQVISVLHFKDFKILTLLKMVNWLNVHRSGTMMLASEAEPVFYTYKTVLNIYFLINNEFLSPWDTLVCILHMGWFLNAKFSIKGIQTLQHLTRF